MPSSIAAPYNPNFTNPSEDENTVGSRMPRPLFSERGARTSSPRQGRTGLNRTERVRPIGAIPSDRVRTKGPGTFAEQNQNANAGIYDLDTNENARANAGITDPGSFAEQNARANAAPANSAVMVNQVPKPAPLPLPNGIAQARKLANDPAVQRSTGGPLTTPLARISPPPLATPGTENANPLAGDGASQPTGVPQPVNPARALGFGSRGRNAPAGTDAPPTGFTGGQGTRMRRFSNKASASLYDGYTSRVDRGADAADY